MSTVTNREEIERVVSEACKNTAAELKKISADFRERCDRGEVDMDDVDAMSTKFVEKLAELTRLVAALDPPVGAVTKP